MKNRLLFILTVLLILLLHAPLSGQENPRKLTLEDIYKSGTYPTRYYRSVRWMEDHQHYTTLEMNRKRKCNEIIRYHAKTGDRIALVGADLLTPQGAAVPLGVRDYSWSYDNTRLLLFTNTQRVWRYHTRGDYWVLDLKTGQLQQLGKSLKTSSLMFARFSPDGSRVAYVSKQNIYVEDIAGGEINQLTFDGGDRHLLYDQ